VCTALAATAVLAAPAAEAATTTTTTTPIVQVPGTTSTTTAAPTTASTTQKPTTTTTKKPSQAGVPAVPVGGPPTSTTTVKPGAKPAPPAPLPNPNPILAQVDTDLIRLNAIADYKSAQSLVARAQTGITKASAGLDTARQAMSAAQAAQTQAAWLKARADSNLRQLAIAAYIGIGDSSGFSESGPANTPASEAAGMQAVDAKEMLVVVGSHARQVDEEAAKQLTSAARTTRAAAGVYQQKNAVLNSAEARLLGAQQNLKVVTAAAITPAAMAAASLPNLLSSTVGSAATVPTINGARPTSPTILGAAILSPAQLKAWWATLKRKPNITVSIDQLIDSYAKWGKQLGVRDDIAFAQSIIETGYFSFPSYGQLTAKDNNFAGIGACDTCATGWGFPTADTGVEAQLELLHLYATDSPWAKGIANVIGGTSIGGCCDTWSKLAGHWASSTVYGISIMTVYHQMLTWLIPQEEMAVGLIPPSDAASRGPELAPLPGGKKPGAKAGATTTTTAPKSIPAAASLHR
jgi:hypothetical protein